MRILIQKVNKASVEIDGEIYSSINHGYCIFLGITASDNETDIDYLVNKLLNVKLYQRDDQKGYFNHSVVEEKGELLIVSQFTLYGSLKKGTKPSFTEAMEPSKAQELYNLFVKRLKAVYPNIKTGSFGAYMKVNIENDGPVTFILDSK